MNQHEPGFKMDESKPEASLILDFGNALMELAKVSTFGAKKYSRGGWLLVENGEDRYTSAMVRHVLVSGVERIDSESGIDHLAHVAWNALAVLELRIRLAINAEIYKTWREDGIVP